MAGAFLDVFRWLLGWKYCAPGRTLYITTDTTADMLVTTNTTDAMYIAADTTADMLITTDTTGGV